MNRRYLVASDLDGTLLGPDGQVSVRTRKAIVNLTLAGHVFVAVTGRSRFSAMHCLAGVEGIDTLVCSNGAYEYDVRTETVRTEKLIPAVMWADWKDQLGQQFDDVCYGWETRDGLEYDHAFLRSAGVPDGLEKGGDGRLFTGSELYKLFVRSPSTPLDELQVIVKNMLLEHAEASTSGAPFVEVTALQANKGNSLKSLAAEMGISCADTWAFGDNHNDLSMLEWAENSYAMGNAVQDVKTVANRQTGTNSEDGVAVILESLL